MDIDIDMDRLVGGVSFALALVSVVVLHAGLCPGTRGKA